MATVVSRVEPDGPRERPLTIGAVCRRLQDEFPDISISKIRYLEDQGLLAPRRTQGGYRLFTEDDVDRLQTMYPASRPACACSGTSFCPSGSFDRSWPARPASRDPGRLSARPSRSST